MPHVRDGDVRVHYRDTGGDGPAVVLIHGFPLNSGLWAPQEEALAPRYRLILPDLIGFGGSDVPEDHTGYSMDVFASNVLAVMDDAGVEQAVVGGLSMGGYVTFALWRNARRRVRALVLADTKAAADTDEARASRSAQQERLAREGTAGLIDDLLGALLGDATRAGKPDVVERARELMDNEAAGWIGALHAMKERPDSTPDLATIDVPALIAVGEEDPLTPPAVARSMHEHIGGSRLAVIPEAGHFSNLESPGHFSGEMAEFLAETGETEGA